MYPISENKLSVWKCGNKLRKEETKNSVGM